METNNEMPIQKKRMGRPPKAKPLTPTTDAGGFGTKIQIREENEQLKRINETYRNQINALTNETNLYKKIFGIISETVSLLGNPGER